MNTQQENMIKELVSYRDGDYYENWKWYHPLLNSSYRRWFIIETNGKTKRFIMQSSRIGHNPRKFRCLIVDVDLKKMEPTTLFETAWTLWQIYPSDPKQKGKMWNYIELLVERLKQTTRYELLENCK